MKIKIIQILVLLLVLIAFVSCDKEVSTAPVETEPPKGFIFVDSNPQNYKIYLDGRFTGRFTPDTLPYVEETEHLIELKKKYWLDSSALIFAEPGVLKSIYIDFMKDPKTYGRIHFKSIPDSATVEINDSLTTIRTPYELEGLLPGIYQIKYHLEQHRSISAKAIVQSSQTTTVVMSLQDTSIWVDYTTLNSTIPTNFFTSIAIDKNDVVWAGTVDKGIVRIKGNSFEIVNTSNSQLPNNRINKLHVSSDNEIWVGTDLGLAKFKNPNSMTIYNPKNSPLLSNFIGEIEELENQSIWIGMPGGIAIIENNDLFVYKLNEYGVNETVVYSVFPVTSTQAWVGVLNAVTFFDRDIPSFQIIDDFLEIGMPSTNMIDIAKDSKGRIWAVFSPMEYSPPDVSPPTKIKLLGGIGYTSGDIWNSNSIGNFNTKFRDIFVDMNDDVWVSTDIGLFKFSNINDVETFRPSNSGIISEFINEVAEDSKGTIWIATENGLGKFKKHLLND